MPLFFEKGWFNHTSLSPDMRDQFNPSILQESPGVWSIAHKKSALSPLKYFQSCLELLPLQIVRIL